MDKWKWTLLICTVALFLLPAAIEWGNSKHCDKRTKIYRRITNCLLFLWIVSSFGIALAMYKDFSRKEKAPELTAYLDGIRIEKDSCVTIPESNDAKDLVFWIINKGDLTTDGLNLIVTFPNLFNVTHSEGWQPTGNSNTNIISYFTKFTLDALAPVDEASIDTAAFLPLTVQTTNLNNSINFCSLRAYAKNTSTTLIVPFKIHFTNGIGIYMADFKFSDSSGFNSIHSGSSWR